MLVGIEEAPEVVQKEMTMVAQQVPNVVQKERKKDTTVEAQKAPNAVQKETTMEWCKRKQQQW